MRAISVFTLSLFLVALGGNSAFADPPAEINLHGQLLTSSGSALTGTRAYNVQFYSASTGGTALGAALTGTVPLGSGGVFNLAVAPPTETLTSPEVWYTLGVDTDEPADNVATDDLFPTRIRVYSVPFALQAAEVVAVDAVRIGDGSVSNTEFEALDGVTSGIQAQIDAIDTSGIATNASAITQLQTDVAAKADSGDVYTKAESDTNFVAVAGDTMSGALGVDTINEATLNAGVTADGVTLKDSYVLLAPISAPGDTTGKLYNVGGSLFFNGAAVGGTTVNKDAINNSGTLGFDWADGEVADSLTIQGGTVNNDSFSAVSDLTAESAIGTSAGQVAAGDHSHTLSNLGGSVTDAQVPDALSISGGTVNNNSFSALSDLSAESAIGGSSGQVAAGDHTHTLSNLGGSVTDAQVPDNITITEADTLDAVIVRGATTDENITLSGANQSINYNQVGGTFAISSDSSSGLVLEGVGVLNGTLTNVTRVYAGDGTAGLPSLAFLGDSNTGLHRTASDTLSIATGGSSRMTVDTTEVNFLSNILEISTGSAPGVTTNKLYNSGGNLFWNGTQLDAGGGGADTDTLQFTAGYVFGSASTVYKHTMPKGGTLVSLEIYGNYFSNSGAQVDFLIGGSSRLQGGAATVLANTTVTPTLSSTSFSTGNVVEFTINPGTSELQNISIILVVEY